MRRIFLIQILIAVVSLAWLLLLMIDREPLEDEVAEQVPVPLSEVKKKETDLLVDQLSEVPAVPKVAEAVKSGANQSLVLPTEEKVGITDSIPVVEGPPVDPPKTADLPVAVSEGKADTEKPMVLNNKDYQQYTVVAGDNLKAIASRYGMTVPALKKINNLSGNMIHIGDQLGVLLQDNADIPVDKVKEEAIKLPDAVQKLPVGRNKQDFVYTVKSGDTLDKIAMRFGLSTKQLKQTNQLKSDLINIGLKLKIPAVEIDTSPGAANPDIKISEGSSSDVVVGVVKKPLKSIIKEEPVLATLLDPEGEQPEVKISEDIDPGLKSEKQSLVDGLKDDLDVTEKESGETESPQAPKSAKSPNAANDSMELVASPELKPSEKIIDPLVEQPVLESQVETKTNVSPIVEPIKSEDRPYPNFNGKRTHSCWGCE